jgi:hypothetical protein
MGHFNIMQFMINFERLFGNLVKIKIIQKLTRFVLRPFFSNTIRFSIMLFEFF